MWPFRIAPLIDYRMAIGATGLAVVSLLGFGLYPSVKAVRADLVGTLQWAGRTRNTGWKRVGIETCW
jgi:hypothetical protein